MAFRDICKQKLRKNYGKTAKNRVFKLKLQLPSKQWVVGSIPARGATLFSFPREKSTCPKFLFPLFVAELQGFM